MISEFVNWLKKYFIPHPENEHVPHLLRAEATLFILTLVLCAEILFTLQVFVMFPRIKSLATIVVSALVDGTNGYRLAQNLPELRVNAILEQAARQKAEDMAARGYFAHVSPDGKTPWYWFEKWGYAFSYAGENLAVNFVDSKDVTDAWVNSPAHRANILNQHFTEIGIGAMRGTYEGRDAVFVAQFFGRPAPAGEKVAVATKATTTGDGGAQAEEMFAAVKGTSAGGVEEPSVPSREDFAAVGPREGSFSRAVRDAVASPGRTANYLYFVLFTIVAVALTLRTFMKAGAGVSHKGVIANGVLMLLLIASAIWVNQFASSYFVNIL